MAFGEVAGVSKGRSVIESIKNNPPALIAIGVVAIAALTYLTTYIVSYYVNQRATFDALNKYISDNKEIIAGISSALVIAACCAIGITWRNLKPDAQIESEKSAVGKKSPVEQQKKDQPLVVWKVKDYVFSQEAQGVFVSEEDCRPVHENKAFPNLSEQEVEAIISLFPDAANQDSMPKEQANGLGNRGAVMIRASQKGLYSLAQEKEIIFMVQKMLQHVSQQNQSPEAHMLMEQLAGCFIACDTDRSRQIRELYRNTFGLSAPFKQQILRVLNTYKNDMLDELIRKQNPGIDGKGYNSPQHEQFPHVKSAYIVALWKKFGIEGAEVANMDAFKPHLNNVEAIQNAYAKLFSLEKFVHMIRDDINRKAVGNVDKDTFRYWAVNLDASAAVKEFSIQEGYYQEGRLSNEYGIVARREAQTDCEEPYISTTGVLKMLLELKLIQKKAS